MGLKPFGENTLTIPEGQRAKEAKSLYCDQSPTVPIKSIEDGSNGFDNITATASVGGFDSGCPNVVSCTTKIVR
jgi:hypothetical protein